MKKFMFFLVFACFFFSSLLIAQEQKILNRLNGFDQYMEKILSDWNAPGIGVGIVYKDKLIFSKGYGYRDYNKKLTITPNTLFQIASNTKLFTATAVGFLVNNGLLEWDTLMIRLTFT
jgi:CubicO group peptidase (beta-lactamase class C family)